MAEGARKKNVAVIFATQSLSDIADSIIAPAIIENCPTRIFLPNGNALEERTRKVYESFGLNERQLQILQQAIPKKDYYYQSAKATGCLNWAWANWRWRSAPRVRHRIRLGSRMFLARTTALISPPPTSESGPGPLGRTTRTLRNERDDDDRINAESTVDSTKSAWRRRKVLLVLAAGAGCCCCRPVARMPSCSTLLSTSVPLSKMF